MSIRRATKADIDRLVDLNIEVHDLHVAHLPFFFEQINRRDVAAYFAGMLDAPGAHVLVACDGPEVVGYMLLVIRERPAAPGVRGRRWLYIEQIGVAEAHRRRGHAAALIEEARAVAEEHGLGRIELDTWGFNTRAQAFFRSQGFETVSMKMGMEV
jgi:diamine N-acetyltransferase